MDFAKIISLVAGVGVVGADILVGGDFMSFVDVGSMMIVIGGAMDFENGFVNAPRKAETASKKILSDTMD